MKSHVAIRLAVLGAIIVGISAGGIIGLLLITRGTTTTESAIAILQRSGAAQTQALAALGPNTTLHARGVNYVEQTSEEQGVSAFARPDTTIGETFWVFDADGNLSAYSSTTTGIDGQLYQHTELVGDDLVTTDAKSGQSGGPHTLHNARKVFTLDYVRGAWSRAITPLVASLGPTALAKTTTVNGTAAFIIETPPRGVTGTSSRFYISQLDYSLLRSEDVAPDGHVAGYTLPAVLEVLPGAVTALPTAHAETPTATPIRGPALTPSAASAGDAMALDADPSTPAIVDASRTVTGSAPFSLGINVTAAADAYEGYQWEIEYPGSGLAFDGAVSEQTRATGMSICTASVVNGGATPLTQGDTVYGGGAGCITASGIASNYTGETTTFNMRCLAAGAFSVQLVGAAQDPSFGTSLLTPGGGAVNTATAAITITCA